MKKYYKLLALILAMALGLIACDSGNKGPSNSQNVSERVLTDTKDMDNQQMKMADENYQEESNVDQSYLIQNADMYFETLKYDDSKKALFEIINNSQGTIQYQNEFLMDGGYDSDANQELRELSLVARIPQADFNQTFEKLQDLPNASLQSASRGSEDVTRSVNDIEIRIKAVEDRLERLNDLLDKAEKIEEIVRIQTEIENAIVQRDQYLAEKANLKNEIDQATINITLRERYVLAQERNQNYSFSTRIANTFKQALVSTKWLLENIVLFLVAAFPLLMILLILYLFYRLVVKQFLKNYRMYHPKKEKKNKMLAGTENEENEKSETSIKQTLPLNETDEKSENIRK
ncbi:DUF4349 domain-containing protein [Facklamia miroungae]|uniref:DUF4349 domain-containing protein n=1 Tax=Facklamia miroungae TaxID=120956 RepID=A0A1G7RI30_9LACT|nr:DUF4349 domain-containing protein [Facklamia miroungae]NKZ29403.1 DUF4349 domain-containing protein [Facklamia miroungae]SDG10496.1 protein of unknown function [Facklamia miroungae]